MRAILALVLVGGLAACASAPQRHQSPREPIREDVAELIESLDDTPAAASAAARALGAMGAAAAPAFPRLREIARSPDSERSEPAMAALVRLGDADAVEALLHDAATRPAAETALAAGADSELLTRLLGSPSRLVRASALRATLQSQLPPDSVTALVAGAASDRDDRVRLPALAALARRERLPPEAVRAIAAALRDEQPRVRLIAARVLGHVGAGAADAVPDLVAATSDTDPAVRRAAALAAVRAGHVAPSLAPLVADAMADGTWKGNLASPFERRNLKAGGPGPSALGKDHVAEALVVLGDAGLDELRVRWRGRRTADLAWALSSFGERARPDLLPALDDPTDVVAVVAALGLARTSNDPAGARVLARSLAYCVDEEAGGPHPRRLRPDMERALLAMGDDAVPALVDEIRAIARDEAQAHRAAPLLGVLTTMAGSSERARAALRGLGK